MLEILYDFLTEVNYNTLNRIQKIEILKKEIPNLMKTAFCSDVDSAGIFRLKKIFDEEIIALENKKCAECIKCKCGG